MLADCVPGLAAASTFTGSTNVTASSKYDVSRSKFGSYFVCGSGSVMSPASANGWPAGRPDDRGRGPLRHGRERVNVPARVELSGQLHIDALARAHRAFGIRHARRPPDGIARLGGGLRRRRCGLRTAPADSTSTGIHHTHLNMWAL